MPKTVIGFVLIDAPHSALNNAGIEPGTKADNKVVVKVIRRGRHAYPYVSAQAWRYWWRRMLKEKYAWLLSEITYIKKAGGKGNQVFTASNPFKYPDDDIFGYMRALKTDEKGTLTRLSPLKCSPLISVVTQEPVSDYGVMARQENDPVPYEHEFYSTTLKGIFSLDLSRVGIFEMGYRSGYKNLDDQHLKTKEIKESIEEVKAQLVDGKWILPRDLRVRRAKDTISALSCLYSTTKGATNLTDVTPKFVILAVLDGGNHIFMNITNENLDKPINTDALRQVITDYKDLILSDIYIGRQDGFIESCKEELNGLVKGLAEIKTIHLSSPKQAIETFAAALDKHIE
jgi:CRISPR-associated protein Cst2